MTFNKILRPFRTQINHLENKASLIISQQFLENSRPHFFKFNLNPGDNFIISLEGENIDLSRVIPLGQRDQINFEINNLSPHLNLSFFTENMEEIDTFQINLQKDFFYCLYYKKNFSNFSLFRELVFLKEFQNVRGVLKRKRFPGILFLIGNLNEEEKLRISKRIKPILRFSKELVTYEEIKSIIQREDFGKKFEIGDLVEIQEDPLRGEIGTVLDIDEVKRTLYINLSFGLRTNIQFDNVKIVK